VGHLPKRRGLRDNAAGRSGARADGDLSLSRSLFWRGDDDPSGGLLRAGQGMEEDASVSRPGRWPCTHLLQLAVSLGNCFAPAFCSHEPVRPWRDHTRPGDGGQEDWAPQATPIQHACENAAAPVSRDLLGFAFLFLEAWLFPVARGRRCCLLAFIPVEKGLGLAWGPCPALAPVPAAGAAELGSRRALAVHPPRDGWGRLQNPADVRRWELLQHAGGRQPFPPRTTGPASRRQAGRTRGCRRRHRPARGTGLRDAALRPPLHPPSGLQGCRPRVAQPWLPLAHFHTSVCFFLFPPCHFIWRSLKNDLG